MMHLLKLFTLGLLTVGGPDLALAAPQDTANNMAHMAMPMASAAMPEVRLTIADWAKGAMLFDGLARVHRPVTTSSPLAQRYFDQGIAMMWGFNHDEATRSFAKAALIDPHCAACFWGVALTVGPNYNMPYMTEPRAKVAREAVIRAQAEAGNASPVERALIDALAKRYPDARALDPTTIQPPLVAYSDAMRIVSAQFDDLDVETLHAEALMTLHAWKLWAPDGTAAPGTYEIVATLEDVLAEDPNHVGANHYYVHAMESSPHPEAAVASAERLKTLAPAEGHLVHMPSHIFQRIGRYEDAAEANRKAVLADQRYAAQTTPPDYYAMYTGHNYQFLAFSAAMEGRQAESIAAADASRATLSDAMAIQMAGVDWYIAEVYLARVRFGRWAELLAMPQPDARLPGLMGGYLYGQAMAQAATGRVADARLTLARLNALRAKLTPDVTAGQNRLSDVLAIAAPMIEARIAAADHRPTDQIAWLRKAVAAEATITYDEPRNWFAPTRHALGAALLAAHDPVGAEAVYRADLQQNPHNGWALHGLVAALTAQGKAADAANAKADFARSWQFADVTPATSEF
jgi:tetratricopeptide (TPR) repeat protein